MNVVRKGVNVPENTIRIITGRLGGKWLAELGFALGDVLIVASAHGEITYQRQENGVERTRELVKFARENRLKLIQVKKVGYGLFIEIPSSCLKKSGIAPNETLVAIYENGILKLQRPDLS
jgi:hypothetical protein